MSYGSSQPSGSYWGGGGSTYRPGPLRTGINWDPNVNQGGAGQIVPYQEPTEEDKKPSNLKNEGYLTAPFFPRDPIRSVGEIVHIKLRMGPVGDLSTILKIFPLTTIDYSVDKWVTHVTTVAVPEAEIRRLHAYGNAPTVSTEVRITKTVPLELASTVNLIEHTENPDLRDFWADVLCDSMKLGITQQVAAAFFEYMLVAGLAPKQPPKTLTKLQNLKTILRVFIDSFASIQKKPGRYYSRIIAEDSNFNKRQSLPVPTDIIISPIAESYVRNYTDAPKNVNIGTLSESLEQGGKESLTPHVAELIRPNNLQPSILSVELPMGGYVWQPRDGPPGWTGFRKHYMASNQIESVSAKALSRWIENFYFGPRDNSGLTQAIFTDSATNRITADYDPLVQPDITAHIDNLKGVFYKAGGALVAHIKDIDEKFLSRSRIYDWLADMWANGTDVTALMLKPFHVADLSGEFGHPMTNAVLQKFFTATGGPANALTGTDAYAVGGSDDSVNKNLALVVKALAPFRGTVYAKHIFHYIEAKPFHATGNVTVSALTKLAAAGYSAKIGGDTANAGEIDAAIAFLKEQYTELQHLASAPVLSVVPAKVIETCVDAYVNIAATREMWKLLSNNGYPTWYRMGAFWPHTTYIGDTVITTPSGPENGSIAMSNFTQIKGPDFGDRTVHCAISAKAGVAVYQPASVAAHPLATVQACAREDCSEMPSLDKVKKVDTDHAADFAAQRAERALLVPLEQPNAYNEKVLMIPVIGPWDGEVDCNMPISLYGSFYLPTGHPLQHNMVTENKTHTYRACTIINMLNAKMIGKLKNRITAKPMFEENKNIGTLTLAAKGLMAASTAYHMYHNRPDRTWEGDLYGSEFDSDPRKFPRFAPDGSMTFN